MNLTTATDKYKDQADILKCNICLALVYEPKECAGCNQIFCKDCIGGWIALGKTQCPHCQNTITLLPLNRNLRNLLEVIIFQGCPIDTCPKKDFPMNYELIIDHLTNECSEIKVSCPNGCRAADFNKKHWQHHYDQECTKILIPCS